MQFHGKKILILSPQEWGPMRVSKHHYACELARMGNEVFFMGPPEPAGEKELLYIEKIAEEPGLSIIRHRLFFPYQLKFRLPWVFHRLMSLHIQRIRQKFGPWDILWDFSNTNLYQRPRKFGAPVWIRHPVDFVPHGPEKGDLPDLVISVSDVILKPFREAGLTTWFIQHGLNHALADQARARLQDIQPFQQKGPLKVGYVGNLRFPTIDRALILSLVAAHPAVEFHFWGAFHSDTPQADPDAEIFVQALIDLPNTLLYGALPPLQLATALQFPDAFLICYDAQKDFNQGSNSHKVLEYLSTGKVVISSYISAYEGKDLLQMPPGPENATLPLMVTEVLANLEYWNSLEKQRARLTYALSQTYALQIGRIAGLLSLQASQKP